MQNRSKEFYGGRFYEHTSDEGDLGWSHGVGFESNDGKEHAAVATVYHPDQHWEHPNGPSAEPRATAFNGPEEHPGQGTLFESHPGVHEVTDAYSSPGARHHMGTLLGMTALNSLDRRGELPAADENLSVHSAKMVQHLVDRGVINNPSRGDRVQAVNPLRRDEGGVMAQGELRHLKSETGGLATAGRRVERGRQFTRDLLRSPRKKFTQIGEQLELIPKEKSPRRTAAAT